MINDAMQANLGFVTSQTSHIEAGVYRIRYPDIQYQSLIPVDTSANPWSTSVTYFSMDKVGQAGWISGKGSDIPMAGVALAKNETPVAMAGVGYDYSLEEVGQASMLQMNLPSEKAMAARRAYEEFVDRVALSGDTPKGFQGLFNYTGVPAVAAPNGAASSPLWTNKTADEIMADCNNVVSGVFTATNTVSMANTLLIPWTQFNFIAAKARTSTSDITILEYLRRYNVYTATTGAPLDIRGVRGLDTIGSGSSARMIAYRKAPEVLKLHIPMPHQFLPVQIVALSYLVPGIFRLGGLDIRLPKEVRYMDGIG